MSSEPLDIARPKFRRQGLGYVFETQGFQLNLNRIRRNSDGLSGHLRVESIMEGAEGPVVSNRFTLDSLSTRKTQANYLAGKTEGMHIDWTGILDRFCLLIDKAEYADVPFTTIGEDEEEDIEWLVENLIIDGQPTTLFAPGGSGKSFIALAIALTVQTGIEFIPGFRPKKKGRVLYMDYESDKPTMNRRLRMLCRGKGIGYLPISYKRCSMSMGDQIEDIARLVTSEGVRLVVIDSVEMTLANQGDRGDANSAIVDLYKAMRQLQVSYLLIDHVSIAESEKTKGTRRPYGTIFKTNLARLAFELRIGSREGSAFNIGIYNTKGNDVAPLNPLGLKVQFAEKSVYYGKADIGEDTKLVEALSDTDQIQRMLRGGPRTVKEIAEATNLKGDSVRQLLNKYRDEKFVNLDPESNRPRWGNVAF